MNKNISERIKREKAFHDERFHDDSRNEQTGIFYKAITSWYEDYNSLSSQNNISDCLELGAGIESIAFEKDFTFKLSSIDISDVAVKSLKLMKSSNNVLFELADAHDLMYEDRSFDRVIGRGILHHLDLSIAIPEIKRVLNDNSQVVFGEPLAGNPLINIYRALTPSIRSEDEQPLRYSDIKHIQRSFPNVKIKYYGFFTLVFTSLRLPTSGLPKLMDDIFLNKFKLRKISCLGMHNS